MSQQERKAEMNQFIGAYLICLVVAPIAGGARAQAPQTSEDAFVQRLKAATDEAAQSDIASALADAKAALALNPNRADGWFELGSILGQAGDFQGAEAAFRRAIQLQPDLAKAHYNLALTFIGNPQGKMDWAGAIAECREALKFQPDFPQALNLLGAGLAATDQPDEAALVLEHASQLAPTLAEAHFTLGTTLESKDRLDEACKEYRAAVAAKGKYPEATSALASLLFRMGKTGEAEEQADEALRLNPDLTAAHYTLARILRSLGRRSEAAVEFAETQDLTDRPAYGIQSSHMSNQGLELASKGDLAGAAALLRKAIALKPDYGVPHFNLGLILADSGDTTAALQELAEGISLLPGQSKPWLEYGRVLERANNYRGAFEAIAWAAKLSPSDIEIRSKLASLQGKVSSSPAAVGQPDVGARSDSAADHLAFARALMSQGDYEGAVGELLRSLALQPAAIEPRSSLAEAYAKLGDNGHAVLEYHKILRSAPQDVEAHIELGRQLEIQGKIAEAVNQFRLALSYRPDSAEAQAALHQAETRLPSP
jgi:tetratricopeptide (TPR) repeat protein